MRILIPLLACSVLLAACSTAPRPRPAEVAGIPAAPAADTLAIPLDRCPNAVTTADTVECMRDEALKSDSMLAALTDSIARTASPAVVARLAEASGHWERYRTAECEAAGLFYEGGGMQYMVMFGCRARLAEDRLHALRDQLPPD